MEKLENLNLIELNKTEIKSIIGGSELSDAIVHGIGWAVGYTANIWNICTASNPFEGRRW